TGNFYVGVGVGDAKDIAVASRLDVVGLCLLRVLRVLRHGLSSSTSNDRFGTGSASHLPRDDGHRFVTRARRHGWLFASIVPRALAGQARPQRVRSRPEKTAIRALTSTRR